MATTYSLTPEALAAIEHGIRHMAPTGTAPVFAQHAAAPVPGLKYTPNN